MREQTARVSACATADSPGCSVAPDRSPRPCLAASRPRFGPPPVTRNQIPTTLRRARAVLFGVCDTIVSVNLLESSLDGQPDCPVCLVGPNSTNPPREIPVHGVSVRPRGRLARILLAFMTAALAAVSSPALAYSSAPEKCGRITTAAQSDIDTHGNYYLNAGVRVYSVSVGSYLRPCADGYVLVKHHVIIDSRALPYGTPVSLVVSTHRSDGRWARAHVAVPTVVSTHQKIEEFDFAQVRGVGANLTIDEVDVRHCACAPGSDALVPWASTVKARFAPWYGPEATARD